jgi:hypothetical protein
MCEFLSGRRFYQSMKISVDRGENVAFGSTVNCTRITDANTRESLAMFGLDFAGQSSFENISQKTR